MNLVEQLVALAQEIDVTDPIDWADLAVSESEAYTLIANNILEQYLTNSAEDRDMILLATVVKLTVENFALNLRILGKK